MIFWWSPPTATSTTPASAPPSSPACWRRRATAWPFWPSRTGTRRRRSAPWASPGTACSSAAAIWIPWWPTTRWPSAAAHGICTVPAARWDTALTDPPSSIPTGRGRRSLIHPSSSADWRRPCAASPTTTTGTTGCAAASSSTRPPTCWSTAWGRAPRRRSPAALRKRPRCRISPMCPAPLTSPPTTAVAASIRRPAPPTRRSAPTRRPTPAPRRSNTTSMTPSGAAPCSSPARAACWW